MELRELRAYVAVIEESGLSAAARRLHVSQPALSQTIQGLERQLGVELIVRSSTGVQATEAGMTLLGEARALLARHDQALAAMVRHSPRDGNLLRIAIPLELPPGLLSRALASLASAFPSTRVEVEHMSTTRQVAALQAGELELGLVRERPIGLSLDVILLIEEPLGVLLATDQATKLGEPQGVRLDALVDLDWLGFPRSGSPAWYDEVTAILRSHGLDLSPATSHTQDLLSEVKLAAVSAGGVFALAPANWCPDIPDTVTWLPLIGNPLLRRTWAAWPATSTRRDLGHLVASLGTQSPE
jgi:DNA-binding transcriptional LysR family regulator